METLTVNVSSQLDGYTFGLAPKSKQFIAEAIGGDRSAFGNVFVARHTKTSFEAQYGPVVKHILLTLLGVSSAQLAKLKARVSEVDFVESGSNSTLYHLNLRDVEA